MVERDGMVGLIGIIGVVGRVEGKEVLGGSGTGTEVGWLHKKRNFDFTTFQSMYV